MARPYTPLRTADFTGYVDDTPVEVPETGASTLANLYKVRRALVRRKGTAPLGTGDLSPDQDLNGVFWAKLANGYAAQELLVAPHNGDVGDWFNSTPGTVLPGGTGVFGSTDVNAAWVNQALYLGDGFNQNQYISLQAGEAVSLASASSQYLSVASNGTLQMHGTSFTLAAWVFVASTGAQRTIMAKWDNTAPGSEYELFVDSTGHPTFTMLSGGAGAGLATSGTITTNAWHLIVAWWDSVAQTQNIQVDNGAVTSTANTFGVDANTTTAFFLGANNGGGSPANFFNGRIDEAAVWKRVLSAAERAELYNNGAALTFAQINDATTVSLQTSLISWWDLEESSGTRVDAAASGNNLTQHATPTNAAGVAAVATVQQVMVAPPTSAPNLGTGGVGLYNGTYQFFVAYQAANGALSDAGPFSGSITVTGRQITLTSIPTSPEPSTKARYIFVTGGAFTDWRLVNVINDNTTTTLTSPGSYIIDPTSPFVFGNTRFPPCRYLVSHQNRLVGAWNSTTEGDKNTVYISTLLEPWYAPAAPDLTISANGTQATLQGLGAGEITGLCPHGDYCSVFTGGSGWFLIGSEAADFRLQLFSNHGCVAHRTIQSVRHLLIWLAPDGVYAWNGIAVERISDEVRQTILNMSVADMSQAHSFVWYDRYYLCWPNGTLWYDLLHRMWGTNTNWNWRASAVTVFTPTINQQRIYAAQAGKSRVWQLEVGATDNGTAIPARWSSRDWDCGEPAHEKRVHLIEAKFKAQASTGLATATILLINGGGNTIQTLTWDLGTVDYAGSTVSRMLASAVEQARDELFRLDIQCSTTASDLQLLAAGIQFTLAK